MLMPLYAQLASLYTLSFLFTDLKNDVSMLLLWVDVGIKVRLAGVDGLLDAFS